MKHYIFQGSLDKEPIDKLLEFITKQESKITIYVATTGGDNSFTEYLLYYLNLNKDRIILFAGTEISSNGFWLFYNFEGQKLISNNTFCIIHKSWMEVPTYTIKDKEAVAYNRVLQMEEYNLKRIEILAQYLTPKEIKQIKKDEDIFLSSERLKQIFKIEK